MTDQQLPPAGWYPDPDGDSAQRYWDGERWGPQAPDAQQQRQPLPSANEVMTSAGEVVTSIRNSDVVASIRKAPIWRRFRKTTWAFIVWTGLVLLWLAHAGSAAQDCANQGQITGPNAHLWQQTGGDILKAGCQAGAADEARRVLLVGAIGYVLIGLIRMANRRRCPVCGENVAKGKTTCSSCNHDFAVAASTPQAQS
jgi:hypothetical protein